MIRTPLRFEKKYCLQVEEQGALEVILHQHPAGFRLQHPARWIQNLYYDDCSFRGWNWHESGTPDRQKWRARWYGKTKAKEEAIRWEQKIRVGAEGFKQIQGFSEADRSGLKPSLRNGYYRHYYQACKPEVRLTIDEQLWFATPGFGPQAEDHPGIPYPITILEIKFPAAALNWVQQMTQAFPWRTQKSSKYVLGCQLLYA